MLIYSEVAKDGRITVPNKLRKEFDIHKGDKIAFRQENGTLEIVTQKKLLQEAQDLLRQYVPEGVSLVDELIAERREEARREMEEMERREKKDNIQ